MLFSHINNQGHTLMNIFKKIISLAFLIQLNLLISAQDFYALDEIQTIEITFAESNWDQLLDDAYESGEYILAQRVALNGVVFDSVGVKYKGNSTYNRSQTKNPWHIELDTYKDQEYQGYTDIKLSNIAKDPSFIREVLSYQILRQYMDASLSNYANVSVNGELIGIYSNSEAVSKKFVKNRFGSKSNTFVKCNPPAGAGPQSNDFPNLVYLGPDSTDYYDAYELKSDDGWQELLDLCDTLANEIDAIEEILDVDRALWMLAFNNALVNLDSYIGGFKQNYYLYRDDYGRFLPVVWDLNESFGKFSMTGSINLNGTTAKQTMDPLLHDNDSDFPLMQKLMSVPTYKRMYIAHYKTMLEENFANESYYNTATDLRATIDAAVQADPNKLFDYDDFLDNLDSDVGGGGPGGGGPGGGGSSPGIATLMDGRVDYLLGQSLFTAVAPDIDNVLTSNEEPLVGDMLTLRVDITVGSQAYLNYRTTEHRPFTKVEMFDDGAHDDGAAGDGIFATEIFITAENTAYYIYAENDDAGKFLPQRAQHEFNNILASRNSVVLGDLVINEFLASNEEIAADQDDEFDDWIELYNKGTEDIDLSGYSLSDDTEELDKWQFPAETFIPAGDYLIIWADSDEEQEGLHAEFKLSASGESVILSNADGEIIDEVIYDEQITDVSYGRFPNGTGDFQAMNPTFGAMNSSTVSTQEADLEVLINILPNPFTDKLIIDLVDDEWLGESGQVYNIDGQLVHKFKISMTNTINTENWNSGFYIVNIAGYNTKVVKF